MVMTMPPGRPRKPISLLKQEKKTHLTKKQITEREKSEVKTGDKILIAPDYIRNDLNAFKKWNEIIEIYKDVDFVTSGDAGFLARYCLTYSEYLGLVERRNMLVSMYSNWDEYKDVLPEDFRDAIDELFKHDYELQLETAINKKMELLIKMEDRSFLNPLAKVKGIPQKKETPKRTPLQQRGFGNV
jgi:phage terminase small subunit